MPFINTKYSQEITPEQEEILKTELGKAIAILGKSEKWLMLNFEQNCTLYFDGEKSGKIAFVDISLYGGASAPSYNMMTKEVCNIFRNVLGVPADKIYVKYTATDNWGWNGGNF